MPWTRETSPLQVLMDEDEPRGGRGGQTSDGQLQKLMEKAETVMLAIAIV